MTSMRKLDITPVTPACLGLCRTCSNLPLGRCRPLSVSVSVTAQDQTGTTFLGQGKKGSPKGPGWASHFLGTDRPNQGHVTCQQWVRRQRVCVMGSWRRAAPAPRPTQLRFCRTHAQHLKKQRAFERACTSVHIRLPFLE